MYLCTRVSISLITRWYINFKSPHDITYYNYMKKYIVIIYTGYKDKNSARKTAVRSCDFFTINIPESLRYLVTG